jgi:hypothetical protein
MCAAEVFRLLSEGPSAEHLKVREQKTLENRNVSKVKIARGNAGTKQRMCAPVGKEWEHDSTSDVADVVCASNTLNKST